MSNYSFSKQEAFAILEGQFLNELFLFFFLTLRGAYQFEVELKNDCLLRLGWARATDVYGILGTETNTQTLIYIYIYRYKQILICIYTYI